MKTTANSLNLSGLDAQTIKAISAIIASANKTAKVVPQGTTGQDLKAAKQASKPAAKQASKPAAKQASKPAAKQASKPAELKLIKYSDKAVAIIGETKPVKDILIQAGGRFNRWLKVNGETVPGWIFSAKREKELSALIK
jgi:guanyl-specific ribonuclease Sa